MMRPVQYIKLRIRKPLITFLEATSLMASKKYANVKVGISFLSLIGYDIAKLPKQSNEITELTQHTAQTLLAKICAPKFRKTLSDIAQNPEFIANIQQNFTSVSQSLVANETTLSPLLIGLTRYNPQFADWMLN